MGVGSNPTPDTFCSFFPLLALFVLFFLFRRTVSLEGNDSTEIRLIDSAFIKLCDSVNDWSMQVREQATQFLVSVSDRTEKSKTC